MTWITNALDTYAVATVERTVRTLSRAHHTAGILREANPCLTAPVREALRAAKVRAANRGEHQAHAAAVGIGEVRAMVATCGEDLPGQSSTKHRKEVICMRVHTQLNAGGIDGGGD